MSIFTSQLTQVGIFKGFFASERQQKLPVVFLTMEDAASITNPAIGEKFSEFGTPVYAPGKVGNAYDNTGGGDNYLISNNFWDTFMDLDKGTMRFWVNFPSLTPPNQVIVHMFGNGSEGILINVNLGELVCGLSRGVAPTCKVRFPLAPLTINTWYRVKFVYDINGIDGGSNILQLYRDNVLIDTHDNVPSGSSGTAQGGFQISRFSSSNGFSFTGKLDEVEAFNFANTDPEVL